MRPIQWLSDWNVKAKEFLPSLNYMFDKNIDHVIDFKAQIFMFKT